MSVNIIIADVFDGLAQIEPDSVDCVVTSPPYWGLRDYGVAGQIGLEPTLGEHLDVMVRVFEAVRRVLKPTGTLWLNYGDTYASSVNGRSAADTKATGDDDRTFRDKPFSTVQGTLKPKDLCMVPNRLAIALQDAGWWVRSEIIWSKPNPMPESVTDRPASSHEKIWLLTKSARYFYDADAVREPATSDGAYKTSDGWDTGPGAHGKIHRHGRTTSTLTGGLHGRCETPEKYPRKEKRRGHAKPHAGFQGDWDNRTKAEQQANGRNCRNVWTIATHAFKDAHFATFPPALAERCIKAGCPGGGTVLDPFGGSGTTALVADRLQRDAILIELNPEYAAITKRRIESDGGMFSSLDENPSSRLFAEQPVKHKQGTMI